MWGLNTSALLFLVLILPQAQAGALQDAIKSGDTTQLEKLLNAGAKVNLRDNLGSTPLHDASWSGNEDAVRLLLNHGALVNARHNPSRPGESGSTPLDYAVQTGNQGVVKLLIAHGANVNLNSPLHTAAARDNTEMAGILIEAGANPNQTDRAGLTPLHEAASRGNESVIALLLERGANPLLRSRAGLTALDLAAQAGQSGCVRLLLNKTNPTPDRLAELLNDAVLKNDAGIVEVLAEQGGAPANRLNSAGSTPLHDAALKGYKRIAEILLAHGATTNQRNKYGATPLHDAALSGHTDLAELLLANGADINAVEEDSGATPLYSAASMGHSAMVALLLAHSADPNLPGKSGHGPRFAAAENGFTELADYLSLHGAR